MIRHASFVLAPAISPLPIAMVKPAFWALLVAAVGAASLPEPCMPLTAATTVTLAAITTGAKKEFGAALAVPANPPFEDVVRHRHAHWQAAVDNGSSFVSA